MEHFVEVALSSLSAAFLVVGLQKWGPKLMEVLNLRIVMPTKNRITGEVQQTVIVDEERDDAPLGQAVIPTVEPNYQVIYGTSEVYTGSSLPQAKSVRANYRRQGKSAVLYVNGEYRG